jgi:hypothetical protein
MTWAGRTPRRSGALLVALVTAWVCLPMTAVPARAYGTGGVGSGGQAGSRRPSPAFRIDDDRVRESSGLAVSRTHPGLAYTVNDSGDDARVLVLSMRDGSVVGETTLSGARADDFEALSPAPGGRLVVGDIGDNDAERDSVEVYVVAEPDAGDHEVRPRTVSLTYPGGPRDAEALVADGRNVYLVSKELVGGVYAAPVLGSARNSLTLRRVATAPSIVTDAALLPDGDVVLRGYYRGFLVQLPGWRVRTSFTLPRVEQGETVASAVHGREVYVGSEGLDSPVYRVPVPTASAADAAQAGGRSSSRATGPAARAGVRRRGHSPLPPDFPRARPAGYLVVAAVVLGIALVVWRRRRRRGRPPITLR